MLPAAFRQSKSMVKKKPAKKLKLVPFVDLSGEKFRDQAAQRVKKILPILKKTYPDATVALKFTNPLELLIATILSAQCTDVRVNMVTKIIFKKYRKISDWAKVDLNKLEQDIHSTGFYHNKAKNIQQCCKDIIERFKGSVPDNMDDLVTLAGVGRKTANCVLGGAFGKPAITCDTHMIRLCRRLGLSKNSDPVKLEFDIAEIVNKRSWYKFSNCIIFHGRNACIARKPSCSDCSIAQFCPAANEPKYW